MLEFLNEIWGFIWTEVVVFFAFDTSRLGEPEMIARLSLQVLLLIGTGFFASSETALFSLSRLDLENLRKKRHPQVDTLHALLDQPRRLIISILCGNELLNIAASANMAGILYYLYSNNAEQVFWINIMVMVPLLLLFGEITPKTVAVSHPVRFSCAVAPRLNLWVRLITPLRAVIRIIADRVTSLIVGEAKARSNILQIDEFRSLVEDVAEEGVLDATERALIYNLLEAGDIEVVEVMTPRTRTNFLNIDTPMPEVIQRVREYRHSRVPVFRYHRDNLVGFLHVEDILRLSLDKPPEEIADVSLESLIHPPAVVPLTKRVDEMFDFFKRHNVRAAAVLNEFGGVEGFITLTDVLTFIFGPITGEVKGQEYYRENDDRVYTVPGSMKLNEFNNLTHFGISDPRMTTIAGVVFRHLDRLPHEGDRVTLEDCVFTVLAMDHHRIARVRVVKGNRDDAADLEPPLTPESAPASELANNPPIAVPAAAELKPNPASASETPDA